MNQMKISNQDQLLYFPRETVLIGQWDPHAALPNNKLPFEPRMIDRKGIIETAVKKCRDISDELPSTHSKDEEKARYLGLKELYTNIHFHVDRKFNLLNDAEPDFDGFTCGFPVNKKLGILNKSLEKIKKRSDKEDN